MIKKILVLDNTMDKDSWGSYELRSSISDCTPQSIEVRRGLEGDFPKFTNHYSHVIISGSKASCLVTDYASKKLDQFINNIIQSKTPLLGICYGHQAIIRATSGTTYLRKSPTPEFGWSKIDFKSDSFPLFKNLAPSFYSFSSHWEEVAHLPKDYIAMAHSEDCAIQAYRHDFLPIYGIQFHPERNSQEAQKTILSWKKKGDIPKILHANSSSTMYNADVSKNIFTNFLNIL